MSVTKRVWIENDPAYEEVRRTHADEFAEHAKEFPFRLKGSRLEMDKSGKRKRSAFWQIALQEAINETSVEFIQINGGLFFRSVAERDRVDRIASHYFSDKNLLLTKLQQRHPPQPIVIREGCCPKCGTTMIRRTAKKGPNASKGFWGCRAFPMCRGTRPLKPGP